MSSEAGQRPPRSVWATLGAWLRELAIVVVGALIASTVLRLFIAQMFVIPSGSMEHTLQEQDRIAVQKVVGYDRGDIVVFRDTHGWLVPDDKDPGWFRQALIFVGLAPDESTKHLVKRVIGVAGDHVTCCDAQGRVTVNGVALDEVSYLYTDATTGRQVDPSTMQFDIVVPAGTIFVMGDHRNASRDSRCYLFEETDGPAGSAAFIPTENVVGSAIAIVFPFDRMRAFGRPDTFGGVPAGGTPPDEPVINGPPIDC
ncbi:MAG: signal peptidase I [Propionibacteriaceae bacterium]|nr:signal peptidase I [Propionibacteriaceae bacterium]